MALCAKIKVGRMCEYCRIYDDEGDPFGPDQDLTFRKLLPKSADEIHLVNGEILRREAVKMNDEEFAGAYQFEFQFEFWEMNADIKVPSLLERNEFGRMRRVPIDGEPLIQWRPKGECTIKKIPVDVMMKIDDYTVNKLVTCLECSRFF